MLPEEPVPDDPAVVEPGAGTVTPELPPETPQSSAARGKNERQKRKYTPRAPRVEPPVYYKKTDETGEPVETQEEHTARLARETRESWHKTYKDWLIHGVFAFLLVVVTLTCLYIVARSGSETQPEATKLASTLLTAIVSGGASFFAGKAAGKAA